MLLVLTVVVSALALNDPSYFYKLSHHPFTEVRRKEYFRWLSSGFIHNDYIHLGVNMFVFYQFGGIVEQVFVAAYDGLMGKLMYLFLYGGSIIAGALPSYLKHQNNEGYAAVGASGGVAGIMFAYALFSPTSKILLYGIIPLYSIAWAVLYLIYEQWAGRRGQDNIGHDAHFYGAVFGFIATAVMIPRAIPHFFSAIQGVLNVG
ncbi:MAG: rhomboid family intramembrane serine protease [Saprospiraceae bacterium]|nr:rhomboid family intramembrane serine protease [Saprospiraceae bacterium]